VSYISTPTDSNLLFGTSDFTIDWWQYRTVNNTFSKVFCIANNSDLTICFGIDSSYVVNLWINGTSLPNYRNFGTVSSSIIQNAWVHIAGVYNGTDLRLYVDNVLATPVAGSGNIVTATIPLWFGSINFNGNPISPYQGLSDDIRIWDQALNATDVADLYAAQRGGQA
jgi:hypothetical protein